MSSLLRAVRTALGVVVCLPSLAVAQAAKPTAVSLGPRPRLPATADSNDASALQFFGDQKMRRDPKEAAKAYQWASSLDPSLGESLYGLRAAKLLSDPGLLKRYYDRRGENDPAVLALDSLEDRAYLKSPFLQPKHDVLLFEEYVAEMVGGHGREFEIGLSSMARRFGQVWEAWLAAASGRNDDALRLYAQAAKLDTTAWGLHAARARIFHSMGEPDSAIAAFRTALKRRNEARNNGKKLVVLYQPQALIEYSIGVIEEERQRWEEARAAYGRATQEDLAFWPAQLRTGVLLVARGDTVGGLAALDLAAQTAPNEAWLRYIVGYMLSDAGQPSAAVTHLRAAATLEPAFAAPWFLLGILQERAGLVDEAKTSLARFVALASQSDPSLAVAKERLKGLTEGGP
jgi:tetratricopeptide (TPR) repeat protein